MSQRLRLLLSLIQKMALRSRSSRLRASGIKTTGKLYGIHLKDEGVKLRFSFGQDGTLDWGLGYKGLDVDISTEIYTDVDTLLNLRDGKTKVLDQSSGQLKVVEFEFFDAVRQGRIAWVGVGATADIERFFRVFKEKPEIVRSMIP